MRRLLLIVALVAAAALSGCGGCGGPSAATAEREAQEFCAKHGGVDHINYKPYEDFMAPAYFDAECVDGSEIE